MSFRIEWRRDTLRRFADELDQLDRIPQREVIDALRGIDRQLISTPMLAGESRDIDSHRVLIQPPVTVVYLVDLRLQIVRVVDATVYWKKDR